MNYDDDNEQSINMDGADIAAPEANAHPSGDTDVIQEAGEAHGGAVVVRKPGAVLSAFQLSAVAPTTTAREAVTADDQHKGRRWPPTETRTRGHARNIGPMLAARRCGAQTRSGGPCRCPAARGKTRCRMHGGAHGSGAPIGNGNARKHGTYTREAAKQRAEIRALCREVKQLLDEKSGDASTG